MKVKVMKIGVILNPIAGMGGAVGLKGTDGDALERALELGASPCSPTRIRNTLLRLLGNDISPFSIYTSSRNMGGDILDELKIPNRKVYEPQGETTAQDTKDACKSLLSENVDLILFCGGDGTARDICSVVGDKVPILGIPSGVKMYSSVFAISPNAAADVLTSFLGGGCSLREAEIMDIDEEKYRRGILDRKLYGQAMTPYIPKHVQAAKCAYFSEGECRSKESIARFAYEFMSDGSIYILGVGSTTKAIADLMGIEKTLLGIDIVHNGRMIKADANERDILELLEGGAKVKIIVSPLGAQGFIFGRGNHQISPGVLQKVGRNNIIVVGTPQKLQNTPYLFVDTGDPDLDRSLSGYMSVVCGYRLAARKSVLTC